MLKVNIKWQSQKFPGVECDPSKPPIDFKAIIFSLTGLPPERQKVVVQGAVLEDEKWNVNIKNGQTIMVIGSVQELSNPPPKTTKFVEDMNQVELGKAMDVPAGLDNLGNTCYMNATLQCLKSIPELVLALKSSATSLGDLQASGQAVVSPENKTFTLTLCQLFRSMEQRKGSSIQPLVFLTTLQSLCPQFAQRDEHGHGFAQQDANECWVEVVRRLDNALHIPPRIFSSDSNTTAAGTGGHSINFVEQFMSGRFECELRRVDEEGARQSENKSNATLASATTSVEIGSSDAPAPCSGSSVDTAAVAEVAEQGEVFYSTESFSQLSCFVLKDLKYLESGIRHGLQTTLTKYSDQLGRDALFKKTLKISRLPCYLAIQILRFSYKETKELSVKILKEITFPMELDLFDQCTSEFQTKLLPMREKLKLQSDKLTDIEKIKKIAVSKGKVMKEIELKEPKYAPFSLEDDIGSSNSAKYELQAVLTHQGRSSRSGHYVAWIRKDKNNWFKCDDEDVSIVSADSIPRLSGGGDWHIAYILLYGPKLLDLNVLEMNVNIDNLFSVTSTNEEPMETS